jgi:hypothetical protein
MATGPDLLEAEQKLFDDTRGGTDGSTEMSGAYMRIASQAFQQSVSEIKRDEDLEAAKNDTGVNSQGSN